MRRLMFRPTQWFECLLTILNFRLPDQGRQLWKGRKFSYDYEKCFGRDYKFNKKLMNYNTTTGGCDDKHGGKDCLANPCYLKNAESNSNLHKGEHRCNAERGGYGRVTWE